MADIGQQPQPTPIQKLSFTQLRQAFQNVGIKVTKRSMQSYDYVAGISGWKIDSDGNVEFNDGTFRGDVILGNVIRTVNSVSEIQPAIDEVFAGGGGTIYLAPGTYLPTTNIDIPSNVYLIGASRSSTIIDFNGGAFSVRSIGTLGNETTNILVKNLTIQNSAVSGLKLQYNTTSAIDGVDVYDSLIGIEMNNCTATGILNNGVTCDGNGTNIRQTSCRACSIYFSTMDNSTSGHGLELISTTSSTIIDCEVSSNFIDGINITSCANIAFVSLAVETNGGQGIELVSGNNDLQFTDAFVNNNVSDGWKLTATSDRNTIVASSITNNGGYGINIAASTCDGNQIIAPAFSGNSSGTINDGGTSTTILPQTAIPGYVPITSGTFGGSGIDGALNISSGTTTINLGSARVVVLNYTSISITGTGQLAFSNPHNNGTYIILKAQAGVTLTSSAVPCIDASGMGALGGAAVHTVATFTAGTIGSSGFTNIFKTNPGTGATAATPAVSTGGAIASFLYTNVDQTLNKYPNAFVGAGGGSGNSNSSPGGGATTADSGAGGRGGGTLIIECGGALNFTGTISVAGTNGGNATVSNVANRAGGGGGGGGGYCAVIYNSLTVNSGTITVTGGIGGNTPAGITDATNNGGGGGGASAINVGTAGTNNVGASTKDAGDGGDGIGNVLKNELFS